MTEYDIPVPVLLVDDNPAKLLALGAALEGMAVDIVTATSGMAALHQLLKQEFAAVLLDVNGFETATLIRSRPRSEHLPILFITSEALSDESRLQGYTLGAVDYVLSPVLPLILRAKVATFADLYRLREQSVRQNLELTETQAQLSRMNSSLEEMVQERTEQARSLFECNADGLIVIDRDSLISAANPVAAQLFGRTVEALLGRLSAAQWLRVKRPRSPFSPERGARRRSRCAALTSSGRVCRPS